METSNVIKLIELVEYEHKHFHPSNTLSTSHYCYDMPQGELRIIAIKYQHKF